MFPGTENSSGLPTLYSGIKSYMKVREVLCLNQGCHWDVVLQLLFFVYLTSSKKADFIVNDKYTIEVGGKNKNKSQIEGIENAFIIPDNIEHGFGIEYHYGSLVSCTNLVGTHVPILDSPPN